jgi:hypothetical protein
MKFLVQIKIFSIKNLLNMGAFLWDFMHTFATNKELDLMDTPSILLVH